MAIIGISGKKGSGKDTIGKIIQILIDLPHFTTNGVKSFIDRPLTASFEIKKFADDLKDMVCMLIGCTRNQLEDEEFKNSELSEEWWHYKIPKFPGTSDLLDYNYPGKTEEWVAIANPRYLVKPTPRLLLQLLGTECGRNILHPNIWVNALMSKYKDIIQEKAGTNSWVTNPNWVITDVRFPNEAKAIKDKQGLLIRVNRPKSSKPIDKHPSETSLDNYREFDEVIVNNGTIEELIEKVREILIKYKYINV